MTKFEQAKDILEQLQLPKSQTNEMCIRVLLALTKLDEKTPWSKATDSHMRIHDIIKFIAEKYEFKYAENSRETIRKQALKPFINAAMVETNGKATNSPQYSYRLTTEFLELIRCYDTNIWEDELKIYLENHKSLAELYRSRKKVKMIDITINGEKASLSLGVHNRLQKQILDEFASRFAQETEVLYIGDTQDRFLHKDEDKLKNLGIEILENSKLPDIILFDENRNWIYFIEAVTSTGAITPQRIIEINDYCTKSKCGFIYVTAFPDFATYKKHSSDLAWDTEIWISEMPDHMIHLNGDRFIGPRN